MISTLTVADAQAMCKSMVDYAQDSLQVVCLSQGVSAKFSAGGSEQTCKTTVDKCTAEMQTKKLSCDTVDNKEFEGCPPVRASARSAPS